MQTKTNEFFQKVYTWMFLGLLISGLTSYFVSSSESALNFIFSNIIIFYGLIVLELALVIILVSAIKKMSPNFAKWMFFVYSFINGITLSAIFLIYTQSSIVVVFFITAGMFGLLSLYGFFTDRDLTSIGRILFFGLIGIIIASIVNIFIKSVVFDLTLAVLAIVIFTGLIAYDTQKLKKFSESARNKTEISKVAIIGALSLYLDFINLFLNLLRMFGQRK
jgi:hypothetical protein